MWYPDTGLLVTKYQRGGEPKGLSGVQAPTSLIYKASLALVGGERSYFEGSHYFARDNWPRSFRVVKDRFREPGREITLSLLEFHLLTL